MLLTLFIILYLSNYDNDAVFCTLHNISLFLLVFVLSFVIMLPQGYWTQGPWSQGSMPQGHVPQRHWPQRPWSQGPMPQGLTSQPLAFISQPQWSKTILRLCNLIQELLIWSWNKKISNLIKIVMIGGGNKSVSWTFAEIKPYAVDYYKFEDNQKFEFMSNMHKDNPVGQNCVKTQIPIQKLGRLNRASLHEICKVHRIQAKQRSSLSEIIEYVAEHTPCDVCVNGYVVFKACKEARKIGAEIAKAYRNKKNLVFKRMNIFFHLQDLHKTCWKEL
jgi:hypothetical protein